MADVRRHGMRAVETEMWMWFPFRRKNDKLWTKFIKGRLTRQRNSLCVSVEDRMCSFEWNCHHQIDSFPLRFVKILSLTRCCQSSQCQMVVFYVLAKMPKIIIKIHTEYVHVRSMTHLHVEPSSHPTTAPHPTIIIIIIHGAPYQRRENIYFDFVVCYPVV